MKPILAILFCLMTFAADAHAEGYLGIELTDDLVSLKTKFPNAVFEKATPAWAKKDEVVYLIYGLGLGGIITIHFNDGREYFRGLVTTATDPELQAFYQRQANKNEDEALSIESIRWTPDNPVPINRILAKYGKPERKAIRDGSYEEIWGWGSRGIIAHLHENGKVVNALTFIFTLKDYQKMQSAFEEQERQRLQKSSKPK